METQAPKRGKTKGYCSTTLHATRDRKRREAQDRDLKHSNLSIKDKIAKAKSRRGDSKKEIARLTARQKQLAEVQPEVKATKSVTKPVKKAKKV